MFGSPARLVIVVVILAAVGQLLLRRARIPAGADEARNRQVAGLNIQTLLVALDQYQTHCGRYPRGEDGLASLVRDPGAEGWAGPYVFEVKPDPWGRPFVYRNDAGKVTVGSIGEDGVPGSTDDIVLGSESVRADDATTDLIRVTLDLSPP